MILLHQHTLKPKTNLHLIFMIYWTHVYCCPGNVCFFVFVLVNTITENTSIYMKKVVEHCNYETIGEDSEVQ